MGNQKICNATRVELDGIKFRSKLEAYTYLKLKEVNLQADYESEKFTLLPSFIFHEEKIRAWTYTPDFIGDTFIIECKGHPNDAFPNKAKMFKYLLLQIAPEKKYYVVKNRKEVDTLINKLKDNKL